jgi:hypothetical protein
MMMMTKHLREINYSNADAAGRKRETKFLILKAVIICAVNPVRFVFYSVHLHLFLRVDSIPFREAPFRSHPVSVINNSKFRFREHPMNSLKLIIHQFEMEMMRLYLIVLSHFNTFPGCTLIYKCNATKPQKAVLLIQILLQPPKNIKLSCFPYLHSCSECDDCCSSNLSRV